MVTVMDEYEEPRSSLGGGIAPGTGVRKNIPAATEAALWALSNGRCYAPGCPNPVVVEVRPGVYRKNAQVAHIYGVRPNAPRYRRMDDTQRDAFSNLLLLCLPHHSEVDDRKVGEKLYPPEVLRKWKVDHEGTHGPALAALGSIDDQQLTELLVNAFTPPLERLEQIADQLERTGTLSATTVAELRQIVDVLSTTAGGPDANTVRGLVYAAEVFGTHDFDQKVRGLVHAAEVLPHAARDIQRRMPEW